MKTGNRATLWYMKPAWKTVFSTSLETFWLCVFVINMREVRVAIMGSVYYCHTCGQQRQFAKNNLLSIEESCTCAF